MKTSLAPVALFVGVIILVLFGIFYLNSQIQLATQSLKYLSEDYIAYQGFLYILFVYIPFDIRYNLLNNLFTNIFSGSTYNINYVFGNNVPNYYSQCEIPFLFNLTNIENNGNNYNVIYSLCVPVIPLNNVNNYQNIENIFFNIGSTVKKDLNQEIEYLNGNLNFKHANFSYQDFYYDGSNNFILANPQYSFFVLNKYERNLFFPQLNNQIDYSIYPFLLYYNELIDYLYNQTFQFIYYNLTNQSDYIYLYQNAYSEETIGDNLYLNFSFNNPYYYVLDLYTSQLLPVEYPNITNVTIAIPCESVGQIVNNQCIVNNIYSEYMQECLNNTSAILSKLNYQVLNKINIFNGYWYNITGVNIINEKNVEVDKNFVENILENYTYYTDGYYPALIPVDIQINYNNVSCSINNETLQFGPYTDSFDCSLSLVIINSLSSCIVESECYNNNGNYYFNATCNISEAYVNNQFTYNYYLYEFVKINDETMNNYCDNSYCYIIG
ncbi:putative membrane protein [Candidatus Nanobsidianus stetteri]|uniref:Putative membrane protein n=1 Tax=Nanobsidianus stetteri TaxID=1294122 RepID=R1E4V4_NANST|nr:putative membrane protein [Candidatus Nanobsidianus stetteri]